MRSTASRTTTASSASGPGRNPTGRSLGVGLLPADFVDPPGHDGRIGSGVEGRPVAVKAGTVVLYGTLVEWSLLVGCAVSLVLSTLVLVTVDRLRYAAK